MGTDGSDLWRTALGIAPRRAAALPADAGAGLARLAGEAFAADVVQRLDPGRPPAALARQSRLRNRFVRLNGTGWARLAAERGIAVVCLKGLAAAHTLYDEPDLRQMSDADLLVRPADRDRLLDVLEAAGLAFVAPRARSPWGFVGDASYLPLVSPDGAANVDVHVHPDAWPLHRGLSTEAVFAAARPAATPRGPILVPAPTHALLIAASNAARDLFAPAAAWKLLDGARLLAGWAGPVDWDEIECRTTAAGMQRPLAAYLELLRRLGAGLPGLPAALGWRPGPLARAAFERLVADWLACDGRPVPAGRRFAREWLLAAGPRIALGRNLRRATGLLSPRPGLPAGRRRPGQARS